jgi:hypothetical protein
MVSKDEFIAAFADELRGLLMESFAESLKVGDHATNGQAMVRQLKRANNLLERCYFKLAGQPPAKAPANGQPASGVKLGEAVKR